MQCGILTFQILHFGISHVSPSWIYEVGKYVYFNKSYHWLIQVTCIELHVDVLVDSSFGFFVVILTNDRHLDVGYLTVTQVKQKY